jgi:PKD repeat protein
MDYTSASCQNMFSIGQGTRMNAAISSTTSGRNNLWASANLISTGIYNSQGAEDTVTYVCSPKADFIPHTPTYVCAGQSLTITDKSWGGAATSRTWYFPGGTPSTSTTLNPSVSYATPGTYSIRLKVANASGSDSISKSSVVIVMPDTAEYKTDFIESFESTSFTNDWTIVNFEPTSKTFVRTSNAAATGSFSCYINSYSNSVDNDIDELISPTFDLTKYANPKLKFVRAFSQPSVASSADNKLQVYASTNCGKTWAQIGAYTGAALNTTTSTTTNSFTPNASQWDTIIVNGTSFYANNQNVRFKFKFSGSTNNQNLYLDNINLLGAINTNGIEEQLNKKFDFAIIPNPSNGITSMNLDLYQNELVHIEMFDALGKRITNIANEKMASGFHQIDLNLNGRELTKGVYFVKVSTSKAVQTKKLIVQ